MYFKVHFVDLQYLFSVLKCVLFTGFDRKFYYKGSVFVVIFLYIIVFLFLILESLTNRNYLCSCKVLEIIINSRVLNYNLNFSELCVPAQAFLMVTNTTTKQQFRVVVWVSLGACCCRYSTVLTVQALSYRYCIEK